MTTSESATGNPVSIKDLTLGELVRNDYRTAGIFQKHHIDFCCGGKRTINDACIQANLDPADLINELEKVSTDPLSTSQNYNNWDIDFLADYIIRLHHHYVRESIPQIRHYLEKLVAAHRTHHPEVIEISRVFHLLAEELLMHMKKEEHVLFPYIKRIFADNKPGIKYNRDSGEQISLQHVVVKMESEHLYAGELMHEIEKLSNSFTPPAEGCNTFYVCYKKLHEFQADLFQHIHLENNILFPKAIELENIISKPMN